MKIGIIGAGFTGLAAGYKLSKAGHDVTIFEASEKPGGLATGFRAKNWEWTLEEHYHHWFTSDYFVRDLAREIDHAVIFKRPKTSVLVENKIYQLDSPLSLLTFPHLTISEKIKTGSALFYLKYTPYWRHLEKQTAEKYLRQAMGDTAWKVLWEPLFDGKFGEHSKNIPASWFWARIKKRSAALGYPEGGFASFAISVAEKILKNKGKIIYGAKVESIERKAGKIDITLTDKQRYSFDRVICSLPTGVFVKLTKGLPDNYINTIKPLKGIGAVTLILTLKETFFKDNTYWLNINDSKHPFLALVEHTNLVDKKNYGNENILYIGNYLEPTHEYFTKESDELINLFLPHLQKINKNFSRDLIIDSYLFKAPFAQPIIPLNYSAQVPTIKTPIDGLYLANMQQVYPWDRGTNYAVELGQKVAELILGENK